MKNRTTVCIFCQLSYICRRLALELERTRQKVMDTYMNTSLFGLFIFFHGSLKHVRTKLVKPQSKLFNFK